MENRLYVGNQTGGVAATTLQELFAPYGFVMDVRLVAGDEARGRRGVAFVTMATDESAGAALKALDGAGFHGTGITVEEASAEGAGSRS